MINNEEQITLLMKYVDRDLPTNSRVTHKEINGDLYVKLVNDQGYQFNGQYGAQPRNDGYVLLNSVLYNWHFGYKIYSKCK
ncbi:MAG: hypothetical protein R3321_02150 [Nitrososphaeraceae archaeon]|nr:hypothetical protein [Nitrososphaeraceae archaeon]